MSSYLDRLKKGAQGAAIGGPVGAQLGSSIVGGVSAIGGSVVGPVGTFFGAAVGTGTGAAVGGALGTVGGFLVGIFDNENKHQDAIGNRTTFLNGRRFVRG